MAKKVMKGFDKSKMDAKKDPKKDAKAGKKGFPFAKKKGK